MKARSYPVLCRAVEEGIAYGYRRAHKHNDAPSEDDVKDAIYQGVIDAVCEWFEFEDRADHEG